MFLWPSEFGCGFSHNLTLNTLLCPCFPILEIAVKNGFSHFIKKKRFVVTTVNVSKQWAVFVLFTLRVVTQRSYVKVRKRPKVPCFMLLVQFLWHWGWPRLKLNLCSTWSPQDRQPVTASVFRLPIHCWRYLFKHSPPRSNTEIQELKLWAWELLLNLRIFQNKQTQTV